MKPETEPIADDEWLIRLVWGQKLTNRKPPVSPNAFEPKANENDGISLYRRACLNEPTDALVPIAVEKRLKYAIVQLPVRLLTELGLSVRPDPRDDVPGHVVIPELNSPDYKAEKSRFTPIKRRLAEAASQHIIRWPMDPS